MPNNVLKTGVVDVENDDITKSLDEMLTYVMNNLKYKEN